MTAVENGRLTARKLASAPLQLFNLALVGGTFAYFAHVIGQLPERVPVHWGGQGPNRFGSPEELWAFPGAMVFLTLVMWFVIRTKTKPISEKGSAWVLRRQERRWTVRMFEFLVIGFNAPFAYMGWAALQAIETNDVASLHQSITTGMVALFALMLGPFIYFGPKIRKLQREIKERGGSLVEGTQSDGWKLGVIYFAPDDPKLLVPKRFSTLR